MNAVRERARDGCIALLLMASVSACHRPSTQSAASAGTSPKPAAGLGLAPPVETPATLAQKRHGEELYARMCAVCHGPKGEGYKADQAPALAQQDFLASVSDDFLRHAIAHGRSGTPMSAWSLERGGPLSAGDIDALIAFLHVWAKKPRPRLDERPTRGNPDNGAEIFSRTCATCHGPSGTAGPNVRIGKSELLSDASNGFLRHAIRDGRPGTPMLGYAATLGDGGVEDVLAYLRRVPLGEKPPGPPPSLRPPPIPLGPVPLNPRGPEPRGFKPYPDTTSVEVVHAAYAKRARMVLLDARASSDYRIEHIAGAVSVPFYDPTPYFDKLPKNTWMVSYCSCPSAESRELAQKLMVAGFTKVTVLTEGFPAWAVKHYPTHKGDEAK